MNDYMIIDSENCNYCSDPKYFKITNLFNELKTEIEKADARYNLGIPDDFLLKWGNITGYIENQKDLTNYLNNFIIIYRNELLHDFEFIQQKLENKIQDEINLMKDDRLVIEGLIQRFINFQDTIDDIINQEKLKVQFLSELRYSYVTLCFMNKNANEEIKCNKIKISSLLINYSKIYSITLRISNNLSLLNLEKTYLHIKDNNGNTIGVSLNGVKQTLNYGKYVTWFFDNVYNIPNDINLSLHTTNIFGGSNNSNLVRMIIYGNKSYLTNGLSINDENDIVQSNWTPTLGINVVNISEIYPQIKSLQKYRMAYATSELPDISTTGHKANIKEIRINQNTMGISLVNSISIMVASDYAYSGELNLKVHDINENLISTSNNYVNLSLNLGKYVTWYFEPFQLKEDTIYKFAAWDNSGNKLVMRIHVASGKNEGITCFDQNNSQHTDYCPAFGINISSIFANNLYKSIKEVNLALGNQMMELSMVTDSLSTKMTNMEGHFNVADLQYLGISPIKSGTDDLRGEYNTNVSTANLQVGEIIAISGSGDGNISSGITLDNRQTITSNTYILEINNNNTATVLAVPNSDNICVYTNNELTSLNIGLLTNFSAYTYQIYNTRVWDYLTSSELQLELMPLQSSISKKVDKVTGKGLSTNDFTNDYKNKIDSLAEKNARVYNFDTLPNVGDYFSDADIFTLSVSNGAVGAEQKEMLEVYREVNMMGSYIFIYIAWRGEPILYSEEYYPESNLWIVNKVDNFNDTEKRIFIRGVNNALDRAESKITSLQSTLETKVDKTYVDTQLGTKVDKVSGKGLSTNDYTTADKNIVATVPNKVDKEYGKRLSTNDYTNDEKEKISLIPYGCKSASVYLFDYINVNDYLPIAAEYRISTEGVNNKFFVPCEYYIESHIDSVKLYMLCPCYRDGDTDSNIYVVAEAIGSDNWDGRKWRVTERYNKWDVPEYIREKFNYWKVSQNYVDTLLSSKVTKTYVDTQLLSINNNITTLEKNKADESSIRPTINGYLSENKESIHVIANNVEDTNYEKTQSTINLELTDNLAKLDSSLNAKITKINAELQGKTYSEWVEFNLYKNLRNFEDYSINNYKTINDSSSLEYPNAALINLSSQTKLILNYLNYRFIIAEKSGGNGCIPLGTFTPDYQDPITLSAGQYCILGFPYVGGSIPPYGSYMTLSGNNLFAQIQNSLNILELRITSLENKVNNIINLL